MVYPNVLAKMPPAVRLTFDYLYERSNQDGIIEATMAEIAQAIGRSRQAVDRAIKRLLSVNLLQVERRRRGSHSGNIYVLNWAKPSSCKLPPQSIYIKTAMDDLPCPPAGRPWWEDLDETEWSFADPERLSKRAHRKFRVLFQRYLPRGPAKVIQVAVGVIVKALEGRPRETWIEVYRKIRRALRDGVLKVKRWLAKGLRAWAAYIRTLINRILAGKGLGWEAKRREEAREEAERRIRRTEEYLREVERWREEAIAQKEKLKAMPSIKDFSTIEEWRAAVDRWADEVERWEKKPAPFSPLSHLGIESSGMA